MHTNISKVGKDVKKLIDDRGLKYTFIAKKAGISVSYLSQILNGKRTNYSLKILSNILYIIGYEAEIKILIEAKKNDWRIYVSEWELSK